MPRVGVLAVQPDGKVISAWTFGQGDHRILRSLPDGLLDPGFRAAVTPVFDFGGIALQETGKLIVAGWTRSPGQTISLGKVDGGGCFTPLTRLNGDGSRDESFAFGQTCRPKEDAASGLMTYATLRDGSVFTANVGKRAGAYTREIIYVDSKGKEIQKSALRDALQAIDITALAPMSDGRIVVAGRRTGFAVERLLEDGTPDRSFHPYYAYVSKIWLQGNNILVLGDGMHRLTRDGDLDATFRLPTLSVYPR
jgi:uncharacterized delta-60 repeat protein